MDSTKFTLRRSAFSSGNAIFIIDCLSEQDLQTGRSRLQELHDLLYAREPERFDYNKSFAPRFEAHTAGEFAGCFQEIKGACALGIHPIIFIDAHGHPINGLRMPSGEHVSWGELLESLDGIVLSASGELTVIVAACHSMKAVTNLIPTKRLPFAFYYGYSSEVKAGVVAEETKVIYQSLFNDGGQSLLNTTHLQIKSFSEYDHVEYPLAIALLMAKAHESLPKHLPQFSRTKIRAEFDRAVAKEGLRLSGSRTKVNLMLNSGQHAIKVVKQWMHDTPRREKVIQDIQLYIQGTSYACLASTYTPGRPQW